MNWKNLNAHLHHVQAIQYDWSHPNDTLVHRSGSPGSPASLKEVKGEW